MIFYRGNWYHETISKKENQITTPRGDGLFLMVLEGTLI